MINAVAAIADRVGSRDLAWTDLDNNIRHGYIRAVALRSELYDLTGEVLTSYDVVLDRTLWAALRPIRRSAIMNSFYIADGIRTFSDVESGLQTYDKYGYDNIRVSQSDIEKVYLVDLRSINKSTTHKPSPSTIRKRGPRPKKRDAVKLRMRSMDLQVLASMTEEEMSAVFQASRDVCRMARNEMLEEIERK